MEKPMGIVVWTVAIVVVIILIIAGIVGYFNFQANQRPEQAQFNKGTVTQVPDGTYSGSATVAIGGWRGKEFNASAKTGINRFLDGNRYEFNTYIAKSLTDNQDVLKIDYDQAINPWWLRTITDEIVQVAPNKYLGKIQIHPIPGLTLTYGYFRLEK